MANPIYATISAAGTSYWELDWMTNPFEASWEVVVPAGVTASYEFDYTLDAINPTIGVGYGVSVPASPTWTAFTGTPSGTTTTQTGSITAPVRALRLVVASVSGGAVLVKVLQGMSIN